MTAKHIGIAILCLTVACSDFICYMVTQGTVTARVKDKQIKRSGDTDIYLVFTDKGVFKNTDRVWAFKCNSSDVQNEIEIGRTYQFRTEGLRIQACSKYKNIIDVKEEPNAKVDGQ